ncbi:MAG: helix-turn-helix domain-containing protein [Dethiobacteraceae bacterium]|jgi:transcriptional regulator with XRE-family HTH domain
MKFPSNITGTRLRILRKSRNLSLQDVASLLNMTNSYISKVELGEYTLSEDNIRLVCEKLGVDMDYFLDDTIEGVPVDVQAELYLYGDNLTKAEKEQIIEIIKNAKPKQKNK